MMRDQKTCEACQKVRLTNRESRITFPSSDVFGLIAARSILSEIMDMEKPVRYVIFGAGAIGSAVGGRLVHAGLSVAFVARAPQVEALKRGILIKQADTEIRVQGEAATSISELEPDGNDVIMIVTKSQVTRLVVEELFEVYGRHANVICLQNGIRNEEVAAERFDNVYAALVLLSAVQLEPEVITMPRDNTIALCRYPDRVDDLTRRCVEDLTRSGFNALASEHVMAMKWGKLVANLNNATHAVTGYWLERGLGEPEMSCLMLAIREEGLRVLDRAGIGVEPPPDEPSPIRIRENTERLRQLCLNPRPQRDLPIEERTYPSMWQDLYLGRKSNEAEFLNGEIVALGKKYGVPTPYNSTLLELIDRMTEAGEKPGIYTPAELHALIKSRTNEETGQANQGC